MTLGKILVMDDNEAISTSIALFLDDAGYTARAVTSLGAALQALDSAAYDVVVADYMLPDGTAIELLTRLRESGSPLPVIVLTGHGSIDLAVRAVRAGAEHFLTKPIELPALIDVVQRTTQSRRAQRHEAAVHARTSRDALDPFLGTSDPMRRLADEALRVAGSDLPVLLTGEAGSGKGVLAAWLHANGPRASETFVDVDCAGCSAPLLTDVLFGHERGAFGAQVRSGLVEIADCGTLFLDEVSDLDAGVQAELLVVVEKRRFRRLGSGGDRAIDVRLVAATRQDLALAEPRDRGDLLRRLDAHRLHVPTLRERPEDIPALAQCIVLRRSRGEVPPELTSQAMRALQSYPWPGNIRELKNVLERAVLLSQQQVIDAADLRLGSDVGRQSEDGRLRIVSLEENERRYLQRVLAAKYGSVDDAAQALGMPPSSLRQHLERLSISLGRHAL